MNLSLTAGAPSAFDRYIKWMMSSLRLGYYLVAVVCLLLWKALGCLSFVGMEDGDGDRLGMGMKKY